MFSVNLLREFSMATNRITQEMDISIYPVRDNRSELGWGIKAFPFLAYYGPWGTNILLLSMNGTLVPN